MSWALGIMLLLGLSRATSGVLKWHSYTLCGCELNGVEPVVTSQFSLNEGVRWRRFRWGEFVPFIQYTYRVDDKEMLRLLQQMNVTTAFVKNGNPSDVLLVVEPSPAWRASVPGGTASGTLLMVVTAILLCFCHDAATTCTRIFTCSLFAA